MLRETFQELRANTSTVLQFMAVAFLLGLVNVALFAQYPPPEPGVSLSQSQRILQLAYQVASAGIVAAAQAIFFSRLGRDIDKPLWKVDSDREALRRFFTMWFIINLGYAATITVFGSLVSTPATASAVLLLLYMAASFFVPFAAAIMFTGYCRAQTIPDGFSILVRQLPKTFLLVLANFVAITIVNEMYGSARSATLALPGGGTLPAFWLMPPIQALSAYVDCVVFTATWLICMEDRATERDDDFEF